MSVSILGTILRQVGTDTSLLGTLTANIAAYTTLTVTGSSGSVTSITIGGVEVFTYAGEVWTLTKALAYSGGKLDTVTNSLSRV